MGLKIEAGCRIQEILRAGYGMKIAWLDEDVDLKSPFWTLSHLITVPLSQSFDSALYINYDCNVATAHPNLSQYKPSIQHPISLSPPCTTPQTCNDL